MLVTVDKKACRLLDSIKTIFDLSETELAKLFGVERASVNGWREHGIPSARQASVERLAELAHIFERELIPSRIPEIVRTPDAWLEDRTILQTIQRDGIDPIYAYLHRLFNYGG